MNCDEVTRRKSTPMVGRGIRPRQTGCLCCRLRHKKCDEEKPVCMSCRKLDLQCVWPQPNEFAWRIRLGIRGSVASKEALQSLTYVLEPTAHPTNTELPALPGGGGGPTSLLLTSHTCSLRSPSPAPQDPPPPPQTMWPTSPAVRLTTSLPVLWSTLDPMSQLALRFYVEHTAPLIVATKPGFGNLWILTILPLSYLDESVLHAVVAVGGVHLAVATGNSTVEQAAIRYLLKAIREAKQSLANWMEKDSGSSDDALRLLLLTSLLSLYECLHGNPSGVLTQHLRGCYPLARVVLAKHAPWNAELVGLLLEFSVHLDLLACLRFPGHNDDSQTANPLGLYQHLQALMKYNTFGMFFGCATQLYEMIPCLRQFYFTRDLELSGGCDMGCDVEFTQLFHMISSWEPSEESQLGSGSDNASEKSSEGRAVMVASARFFQHALMLFLYSAFYRTTDHERLVQSTQPLVDESMQLYETVRATMWANTIWWPLVMVDSFATTEAQRSCIIDQVRHYKPTMALMRRGEELLMAIWSAPEHVFGLDGIANMVEAKAGSYCFG